MSLQRLRKSFAKIEDLSRWERSISLDGTTVVLRSLSPKDHLLVITKTLLSFQDFLKNSGGWEMLQQILSSAELREGTPDEEASNLMNDPGVLLMRRTFFEAVSQVRISTMVETTLALAIVEIDGMDLRSQEEIIDEKDNLPRPKMDALLELLSEMWSSELKIRLFQKYNLLSTEVEMEAKAKVDLGLKSVEDRLALLKLEISQLQQAKERAEANPITPVQAQLQELTRIVDQGNSEQEPSPMPVSPPTEMEPILGGRTSLIPSEVPPPGNPMPSMLSSLRGAVEAGAVLNENAPPLLDRRAPPPLAPQPLKPPSENPRFKAPQRK